MPVLKPCLTLFYLLLLDVIMEAAPLTILLGIIIIFVHHATYVTNSLIFQTAVAYEDFAALSHYQRSLFPQLFKRKDHTSPLSSSSGKVSQVNLTCQ